jgi:hypothetical protein
MMTGANKVTHTQLCECIQAHKKPIVTDRETGADEPERDRKEPKKRENRYIYPLILRLCTADLHQ